MMDHPVAWKDFVAPLDYTRFYSSPPALARWLDYEITSTGLRFSCQVEPWPGAGEPPGTRTADVRVDIINDSVIRFRMGLEPIRERQSDLLLNQEWQSSPFEVRRTEAGVDLSTKRIRLEIHQSPWCMKMFGGESSMEPVFSQQILDLAYGPAFEVPPPGFQPEPGGDFTVRESVAVAPGEAFYGFGEKFSTLNKWNQEIISWAMDSGNVVSPRSYKNIPFFMSSAGYGVFVHTSFPVVYRMGSQSLLSYSFNVMAPELDYFLIYGPSFKKIIKEYCSLTGFAPVPPKWSFGFWLSRCGYKNRAEVETTVSESRRRGLPLDVISLDPWWMGEGPWTTLEWDENAFQDPQGMIAGLRRQNVRTCLWIHPYLPVGSRIHDEAVAKKWVVKNQDGSPAPVVETFTGSSLAAVDFTNPQAVAWFQEKLERLLDMGVAVFKTDFGEQAPVSALYDDGRTGAEIHNLYPLLYNRAVFDLTRRYFGRGLVWGRSAYAGSQRYPVQWGGDSYSSFGQLHGQLRGLLSYGMSGVPFCSHDIGGFDFSPASFYEPGQPDSGKDPEVYIRWLQVGVFSSHMRAHGKQPREPWTYGSEVETIARKFLNLRYRLLPYIYSEAVRSSQTGLPMVRPMALEYQEDPNTLNLDDQYLFGGSLLVAPILSHSHHRRVYLPAGDWFDFWSKKCQPGGRWIEVEAPLDRIPLWVKGGSILPFGPEMPFVDAVPLDPLTLEIYLNPGSQFTEIYDEDRPTINIHTRLQGDCLELDTSPTLGQLEISFFGVRGISSRMHDRVIQDQNEFNRVTLNLDGRRGVHEDFEILQA